MGDSKAFHFNIRKADIKDAQIIADFNSAMAKETENKELDPDTILRGCKAILKDPHKGFYLVAEYKGEIVGQMMSTPEWSDWRNKYFYWIQSVYITPEFRRKGVFSGLYNYLKDFAHRKKNVVGVRLYVEKNNETAKETYEALGMFDPGYDMYEESF